MALRSRTRRLQAKQTAKGLNHRIAMTNLHLVDTLRLSPKSSAFAQDADNGALITSGRSDWKAPNKLHRMIVRSKAT